MHIQRQTIHKLVLCIFMGLITPARAFTVNVNTTTKPGPVIPVPKSILIEEQTTAIPATCTLLQIIMPESPALRDAMEMIKSGLKNEQARFTVVDAETGNAADVELSFVQNSELRAEEYRLTISKSRIVIEAADAKGLAWAGVTLEQLFAPLRPGDPVPELTVLDRPDQPYRGIMIDVARQPHPIEVIHDVVKLCHWYKLGYLHIHFTDSQLWTLPSDRYPQLSAENTTYTKKQLQELEQVAATRGVTIIPEIDVPGHSAALLRLLPELGTKTSAPGRPVLDVLSSRTYDVLDTLIGELCEIFPSTPYIHLGADEVKREKEVWPLVPGYDDFLIENNLKNADELYRYFVGRMARIIVKHGKTPLAWEGVKAEGNPELPHELVFMEYECYYEMPQQYVQKGYNVINTTWVPLYITQRRQPALEDIYSWDVKRWGHWWKNSAAVDGLVLDSQKGLLGAQICAWELPAEDEIKFLCRRAGVLAERLWNNERTLSAEDCILDVGQLTTAFLQSQQMSRITQAALRQTEDTSEPSVYQTQLFDRFEGSDIRNWKIDGVATKVELSSVAVYSGNESLAVHFETPGQGTYSINLWSEMDNLKINGVGYQILTAINDGNGAVDTKVRLRTKNPSEQYALKFYSEVFKQKLPICADAMMDSNSWKMYTATLPDDVSKVSPNGNPVAAPVVDRFEILIRVTTDKAQKGVVYVDDLTISTP